jgi:hypothetical protein
MILANVFDQMLGVFFTAFFTVTLVIAVAITLGVRFLKKNDEARKVAKRIGRAAALKLAEKWLSEKESLP